MAAAPFYFPTNRAQGSSFSTSFFVSACYFLAVTASILCVFAKQVACCFITDFDRGLSNCVSGGTEGEVDGC